MKVKYNEKPINLILFLIKGDELCYECDSNENTYLLLVCDSCKYYCCHTYCLDPPLNYIPEEEWICYFCQMESSRSFTFNLHSFFNNSTNRRNNNGNQNNSRNNRNPRNNNNRGARSNNNNNNRRRRNNRNRNPPRNNHRNQISSFERYLGDSHIEDKKLQTKNSEFQNFEENKSDEESVIFVNPIKKKETSKHIEGEKNLSLASQIRKPELKSFSLANYLHKPESNNKFEGESCSFANYLQKSEKHKKLEGESISFSNYKKFKEFL